MTCEKAFAQLLNLTMEIYEVSRSPGHFFNFLQRLEEALQTFIQRQHRQLDQNPKRILFGAGNHGRRLWAALRDLGIKIDYFCDNDANYHMPWLSAKTTQHSTIDGLYVLAPDELSSVPDGQAIIATDIPHFRLQIQHQLHQLGIPLVQAPEVYLYEGVMLKSWVDFYLQHWAEIDEVCGALADERSLLVYLAAIKARCVPYQAASFIYESIAEGRQYWALPQFWELEKAVFLDAGAYTGDTFQRFLRHNCREGFDKAFLFECDSASVPLAKAMIQQCAEEFSFSSDKVKLIASGVGCLDPQRPSLAIQKDKAENYLSRPQTMELWTPDNITSIDELLAGERAGFIKADIEGFEQDMLWGARQSIKKWRPRLAICIYHLPEDMFAVPLYIKSLLPQYNLAVRHHYPGFPETVLYAW